MALTIDPIIISEIDGNQCIGNTLDTFNDNFTTIRNAINGAFAVKAAGSFSGTTPSIAHNIESPIGYTATGKYAITFSETLPDDYIVTVSSSVVGIAIVPTVSKLADGFIIEWKDLTGADAANGGVIDFVVHAL